MVVARVVRIHARALGQWQLARFEDSKGAYVYSVLGRREDLGALDSTDGGSSSTLLRL